MYAQLVITSSRIPATGEFFIHVALENEKTIDASFSLTERTKNYVAILADICTKFGYEALSLSIVQKYDHSDEAYVYLLKKSPKREE
jgi:hypothetical protein